MAGDPGSGLIRASRTPQRSERQSDGTVVTLQLHAAEAEWIEVGKVVHPNRYPAPTSAAPSRTAAIDIPNHAATAPREGFAATTDDQTDKADDVYREADAR